jgi:hypothetical protein
MIDGGAQLATWHVAAVVGMQRKLGLADVLSRRGRQPVLSVAMIAAHIIDPASKLAMARGLGGETARGYRSQSMLPPGECR